MAVSACGLASTATSTVCLLPLLTLVDPSAILLTDPEQLAPCGFWIYPSLRTRYPTRHTQSPLLSRSHSLYIRPSTRCDGARFIQPHCVSAVAEGKPAAALSQTTARETPASCQPASKLRQVCLAPCDIGADYN